MATTTVDTRRARPRGDWALPMQAPRLLLATDGVTYLAPSQSYSRTSTTAAAIDSQGTWTTEDRVRVGRFSTFALGAQTEVTLPTGITAIIASESVALAGRINGGSTAGTTVKALLPTDGGPTGAQLAAVRDIPIGPLSSYNSSGGGANDSDGGDGAGTTSTPPLIPGMHSVDTWARFLLTGQLAHLCMPGAGGAGQWDASQSEDSWRYLANKAGRPGNVLAIITPKLTIAATARLYFGGYRGRHRSGGGAGGTLIIVCHELTWPNGTTAVLFGPGGEGNGGHLTVPGDGAQGVCVVCYLRAVRGNPAGVISDMDYYDIRAARWPAGRG